MSSFHCKDSNFILQKQVHSTSSLNSFQNQIATITGARHLFKCGTKKKQQQNQSLLNASEAVKKAVKAHSNTRKHSLGHVPTSALINYNLKTSTKRQTIGTQKSSRNSSSSMSIAGSQPAKSKMEELRNKYKSEHTIYEKNQG